MRSGVLAWLGGVVLFQQLAELPSVYLLIFFPIALAGLWRIHAAIPRLLAWALGGFLWSLGFACITLPVKLDDSLLEKNIIVEGSIASLAETHAGVTRFEFDVSRLIAPTQAKIPEHLRVSWRNTDKPFRPGDQWRLSMRLKSPRGFSNPASFDYEALLLQKGIGAIGYVNPAGQIARLDSNPWKYPIQSLRQRVRDRLDSALSEQASGRIIEALVLGLQTSLTSSDWEILRATGTSHLLAISGLHISLIAGSVFWLVGVLWRCSAVLTLRIATPRAAAIAASLAALSYSALAGFSIPTQRSCVMLAVVFAAIFFNYRVKPSCLLAFALWLVLLFDPLAVMAIGFWLSFAAVAIILFISMGRNRMVQPFWYEMTRLQVAICLGLIPFLIILFEQIPIYSPLVNLLAVPYVTFVVLPLSLVGTVMLWLMPVLGQLVLDAAAGLIDGLWWLLEWAARLPNATLDIPAISIPALLMGALGLILLGMPPGLPKRWLAFIALIPMCLPSLDRPGWGEAYFTLLDVGQGLAAVVQTRDHVLVFDTGPRYSDRFNTGTAVVVPFLRHSGYNTIDHLIISHGDIDHLGGVEGIAAGMAIKQASSSVPQKIKPLSALRCQQGQHWEWEGVTFKVIHPPAAAYTAAIKGNDLSCVLRVSSGNQHILLTGDIESRAEATMIRGGLTPLRAQILVAPHHGSQTSSTEEFIQAVRPDYVLFATGRHNRHHFPHLSVVTRYQAAGAVTYDTATAGAIRFWLHAGQPSGPPQCHRLVMQRYWRQP